MMTDMPRNICTTSEFPVSPLAYKRAIVKPAPSEFTVEVLTPVKQGNQFSYGIRVCPVFRSCSNSDSQSTSMSSYSEYDIWRRWEDCLDFQDTLETVYEYLSRNKVTDLKRGARGKKRKDEPGSPYTLNNAAASFESLPEGPDPREVILDVHKLIPSLNRKATVLRVSQSMLQQREDEFAAMIGALFNPCPDAPVLLQELRNHPSVRDFFAVWRRDQNLAKKSSREVSRGLHSRRSTSSLSTLFSNFSFSTTSSPPLTPTTPPTPPTPPSPSTPQTSSLTAFLSRPYTPAFLSRRSLFSRSEAECNKPSPASAPPALRGFKLDTMPGSPSPSPKGSFEERCHSGPPGQLSGLMTFTDELLLRDEPPVTDSSDQQRPSQISAPHSSPLPARKLSAPSQPTGIRADNAHAEDELPRPLPRPRGNSGARPGYRNARIFLSPPVPSLLSLGDAEQLDSHASANSSDDEFSSASHTPLGRQDSRSLTHTHSLSSLSPTITSPAADSRSSLHCHVPKEVPDHDTRSFHDFEQDIDPDGAHSDSLVEQFYLPGTAEAHESRYSGRIRFSTFSIASLRTELSANGVLPLHLRSHMGSQVDAAAHGHDRQKDPRFEELSPGVEDFQNEYITELSDGKFPTMEDFQKTLPDIFPLRAKEPLSSTSSLGSITSTSEALGPHDDTFAVKAVYGDCVVVLRTERAMPLAMIRRRIQERFNLHERVPLADGFGLTCLPPAAAARAQTPAWGDSRASSTDSDVAQLQLLKTEADWQSVLPACNGKLTLHVLDATPTAS